MPDDAPCRNRILVMRYGIGNICALHEHLNTAILTANLGLIAMAILSTVLSAQRLTWLIVGCAVTLALLWYLATRRPLVTRPRSDHAS